MDNNFFSEDSKRNGIISTILKKLADIEKFIRDHQSINHSLKTFVDRTAFTPVVTGTTIAGVGTYTTQAGEYSRVGNIVFFQIALVWTAHTGTGNMTVTGIPITSANNNINAIPTVFFNNITLLAVGNKVQANMAIAGTTINIQEIGSGTFSAVPMDAAGVLRISGFYFVD